MQQWQHLIQQILENFSFLRTMGLPLLICPLKRIKLWGEEPSGDLWLKRYPAVLNQSQGLFVPGPDLVELSA